MPTAVDHPSTAANPAGGIAAAIVTAGQNAMLGATAVTANSASSTLGLPDLTGLDVQEQVCGNSLTLLV